MQHLYIGKLCSFLQKTQDIQTLVRFARFIDFEFA